MVKPRGNVEYHEDVIPVDEETFTLVPFKLETLSIRLWHPDRNAEESPEQVHLLLEMEEVEEFRFVLRFASPDTLGFLIEELARYRREVWPDCEPLRVDDGRDWAKSLLEEENKRP